MRVCFDAKRSWVGDPIWLSAIDWPRRSFASSSLDPEAGEGLHQALSENI